MPRKKKFVPARDIPTETRKRAEDMASRLGGEPKDYRSAEYYYFNDRSGHWTVKYCWERFIDGEWVELSSWDVCPPTPSSVVVRNDED